MKNIKITHTLKKLPKSLVELKIEVPAEILELAKKRACEQISRDVKVKGFRPGHVPPHILELHIDKKYIDAHTQDLAIQRAYAQVIIDQNLQIAARPKVKIDSENPLTFTATVAVMPEVVIKDYKNIKVAKEEVKVTEKDIDEVIADMKKYATVYKDVEREAKKGDRVEVDFEGFDKDDKAVAGTKSQNHPVILGGNSLIPGFEDEIVGLKKDEKKEFDITFPKDYGKKDFQGKKLKFKVEVKRVEEAIEPEINDEFVEKITGKKESVADFRKNIEKNVQAQKEEKAQRDRETKYIEELIKKADIELPDDLVDEEAEYILQEVKDEISAKNFEFAKFLEQSKTTEDDLRKKYRPEAERRLKMRLAIQYILKTEKIEVSKEDLAKELEHVKSFYPEKEHRKIQDDFNKGTLRTSILNRLTLKKFFAAVLG
ncbi:trigger factor [Candidatus Peregrinibacteria bacterium]|nr:trigger factor [Candidatus Peregrinibacteria bacterium]